MADSNHLRDVAQTPALGWFDTLHAPVTFFLRPRATLRAILHGPASALAVGYAAGVVLFVITATVVLVLVMSLSEPSIRTHTATISGTVADIFGSPPGERLAVTTCCAIAGVLVGSCIWTGLLVLDVHRSGPLRRAIVCSLRLVTGGPWLLTFNAIMTACITLPIEYCALEPESLIRSLGPPVEAIGLFPSIALSIAAFIVLSSRAARLAGDALPAPMERPPLCEGCGYDLSHVSAGGVCTECGLSLAKSLDYHSVRPGNRWESQRKPKEWQHSSLAVAFKSTVFYQTLKLRTPINAATAFSRIHFVLMGLAGGIWVFVICLYSSLSHRPLNNVDYFIAGFLPFLGSVWVPCAGWVLHRMVFSIAAIAWMLTGSIPDARWLIKVREYETAFLWLFCAFNGTWISLVIVHPAWMNDLAALCRSLNLPLIGMPLEMVGVLAGNAALILVWFFRYRRIHQAIRWSNS